MLDQRENPSNQFFTESAILRFEATSQEVRKYNIIFNNILQQMRLVQKPLEEISRLASQRLPSVSREQAPHVFSSMAESWQEFEKQAIKLTATLVVEAIRYPQLRSLALQWIELMPLFFVNITPDDFVERPNDSLAKVELAYAGFMSIRTILEASLAFRMELGPLASAVHFVREATIAPHLEQLQESAGKAREIAGSLSSFRAALRTYSAIIEIDLEHYLKDIVEAKKPRMKQVMLRKIVTNWENFKLIIPDLHESLGRIISEFPELATDPYTEKFSVAWRRVAKLRLLTLSDDIQDPNNQRILMVALEALIGLRAEVDAATERASLRTKHAARATFQHVVNDS